MKLLILLCLSLMITETCEAQDVLPDRLRDRVDQWLTNNFDSISNRQNVYKTAHGKFFQGLITHKTIPNHTSTADGDQIGDKLTAHPTDQAQAWVDVFPALSSTVLAAAIKIDVYNGPNGEGWLITILLRHNGFVYARTKATGNESSTRDSPWAIYDQ